MNLLNQFVGQRIEFDVLGEGKHTGILIEAGSDIIVVLEDEMKFLYIPIHHVRRLALDPKRGSVAAYSAQSIQATGTPLSLSSIIQHAKGLFCEIYLSDHKPIHGYISDIMDDYFTLATPLNKVLLIPLLHLKWISPFEGNSQPYSLDHDDIVPIRSATAALPTTFEELLKQRTGSIISLNEGLSFNTIGKLQTYENHILELVTADEKRQYYHVEHIKNVCFG